MRLRLEHQEVSSWILFLARRLHFQLHNRHPFEHFQTGRGCCLQRCRQKISGIRILFRFPILYLKRDARKIGRWCDFDPIGRSEPDRSVEANKFGEQIVANLAISR